MNRRTIVAANWKMNGNLDLVSKMSGCLNQVQLDENVDVIICPSYMHLPLMSSKLHHKNCFIGAQNVNKHESGAYTGEISVSILHEFAVKYAIVGHSERRNIYKETSIEIAHKVKTVLKGGLTPILCIGESEAERTAEHTETVLASQLQPVIDEIGINKFKEVVIAYEPVWAIGTGKTASPAMAQATHQFIRQFLAGIDVETASKVPLLYGGSVNAQNFESLFAQADIDGGLLGGASLKVDEFLQICSTVKGSK